jgi:hypothetical protein
MIMDCWLSLSKISSSMHEDSRQSHKLRYFRPKRVILLSIVIKKPLFFFSLTIFYLNSLQHLIFLQVNWSLVGRQESLNEKIIHWSCPQFIYLLPRFPFPISQFREDCWQDRWYLTSSHWCNHILNWKESFFSLEMRRTYTLVLSNDSEFCLAIWGTGKRSGESWGAKEKLAFLNQN